MKNKEIAIKEAYCEHWETVKDYVDEKGWCVGYWNICEVLNGISKPRSQGTKWRPKSLDGLEDNNGWKKIESEADLPKENGPYWVVIDGIVFPRNYNDNTLDLWKEVTHYIKFNEPHPPIY